jgi:hypothetical protein
MGQLFHLPTWSSSRERRHHEVIAEKMKRTLFMLELDQCYFIRYCTHRLMIKNANIALTMLQFIS